MNYLLIPIAAVIIIGVLCLNIKAGYIVAELTENTGFDAGFYMMTVVGLIALELSLIVFTINWINS